MFWSLLLMNLHAAAQTSPATHILFYCKTDNQKSISVFKQGANLIYQYGMDLDKPELHLVHPEKSVEQQPWAGVGNSYWNYLTFKNQGYSYSIGSSHNRNEGKLESAGVSVSKDGKSVARIDCKPIIDQIGDYVEPVY